MRVFLSSALLIIIKTASSFQTYNGLARIFPPSYHASHRTNNRRPLEFNAQTMSEDEELAILMGETMDSTHEMPVITESDNSGDVNEAATKRPDYLQNLNGQIRKNLVQDVVRTYKEELLEILLASILNTDCGEMRRELEEKLAGLIRVNPVSTTTDSNLLDGNWELAYVAKNATAVLESLPRFDVNNNNHKPSKSISSPGGSYRSSTRDTSKIHSNLSYMIKTSTLEIDLEQMKENELPYVLKRVSLFGGLIAYQRKYNVSGLTRRSIEVLGENMRLNVGPIPFLWFRSRYVPNNNNEINNDKHLRKIEVLYLDSEICISTSNKGMDGPLFVHTKAQNWISRDAHNRRKLRLLKTIPNWFFSIESPFQVRKRILRATFGPGYFAGTNPSELGPPTDKILVRKDNGSSEITMLRIGEVSSDDTNMAWDGDEDPYAHLEPDERQEMMKKLKINEILREGQKKKKRSQKERKKERGQLKSIRPPPKI